jgi:hypothetical protein
LLDASSAVGTPLAKHAGSFYEELLQRLRELAFLAVKSLRFDSKTLRFLKEECQSVELFGSSDDKR